jgi:DNA repair exonuclease SbcCD nuclease subunit
MRTAIRILLLADTHLGYDLPTRPRVRRRRRGHDFQANYEAALAAALTGAGASSGGVDLVVHGGDLFHRPRVAPGLAYQGLAPLVRVADAGVPVVLVPGNHERSRIPHAHLGRHPGLHVLERPRTVRLDIRGVRVSLVGFPFVRDVRRRFPDLLRRTGWRGDRLSLLCLHQCVEGATVGPSDFRFTTGDDVIRARDIPAGFAAVLCGHIHRQQVLTRDLRGRLLPAPVLYPGSVERTSVAEKDEPKGYLVVELGPSARPDGGAGAWQVDAPTVRWRFHRLPARPMLVRELVLDGLGVAAVEARLRRLISEAPADAVVRIRTRGTAAPGAGRVLSAAHLRRLAPAGMNVELRDGDRGREPRRRRDRTGPCAQPTLGL